MSLSSEGQSLSANQISSTYLNWRLKYNYFRFLNTNVRHIGIPLPVSIVSFCIRLPIFVQIGTSGAEIWRHIDFQDGGRQPCCIYFGVMADHPRCAFRGLIPSSNREFVGLLVPEILRCKNFGVLAWNCLFTPLFGEFLGDIFTHRPDPQKALRRSHVKRS